MRNIALFGHMAAGKSTIAAALEDAGYVRLSFAGPLKNVAELAYGKVDKGGKYIVTNEHGIEHAISGREVLQNVGQSIKSHDRDFWLRCFFRTAGNYKGIPVVVEDGRFFFERDALRKAGYLIVGVLTPDTVRMQRYQMLYGVEPTPEARNHASERDLDDIMNDADIVVSGTEDPYWNLKRILDKRWEAHTT